MFHCSFNVSAFVLLLILLTFDITLQSLKFLFNVQYISTTLVLAMLLIYHNCIN